MVDLFNFDFTEDVTDEKLEDHFYKIQLLFKKNRNGHLLLEEDIPSKTLPFVGDMIEKGWLKSGPSSLGYDLPDKYIVYHTVEEVVEEFREKIYEGLDTLRKEELTYYEYLLPIINSCLPPIRTMNNEVREEIIAKKEELKKDVVLRLGLQHFKEKPASRGTKMNPLNTSWAKENVLPIIVDNVQIMEDFEEIKDFFHKRVWFIGREDWDRTYYRSDMNIPPYPIFRQLMPSDFAIACLTQAVSYEDIELILEYSGSVWGYSQRTSKNKQLVFPEGWDMGQYFSTLTNRDLYLIRLDQQRLKRMHKKGNSYWFFVFNGVPLRCPLP